MTSPPVLPNVDEEPKPRSRSARPAPPAALARIESMMPRPIRRRWVTLRTDLAWVVRDLRGVPRPVLVERGPSRYVGRASSASLAPRPLRVVDVTRETADAVTLTLEELGGDPLAFEAGQFLTFHLEIDGRILRRAYSLSGSPLDGAAQITVKRIAGGRASTFLNERVEVGHTLHVLGPSGSFLAPAANEPAELVMIAGGSGITPVRSILSTVLATRPELSAHLVYGNRAEADIIFRDALDALAAAHPRRLSITHALEAPPPGFDGLTGRLDADVLAAALDALPPARAPRLYYVCGPGAMMDAARAVLIARGVDERDIEEERFQSPGDSSTVTLPDRSVTVRVRVGGRDHIVPVEPGKTLLEAGLAAGAAMPFSCAMGGCAACKGRLVAGEVALEEPNCLSPRERAEGLILTCCARPLGAVEVEVE